MNCTNENKKREAFRQLLFDLASGDAVLSGARERVNYYIRLEDIYDPTNVTPFRHFYSDIFSVLTQVKQNKDLGDIQYLGLNLQQIREGYQAKRKDANGKLIDAWPYIQKLYDHVSLDIARLAYSEGQSRKASQEENIQKLRTELTDMKFDVEKNVTEKVKKVEDSLHSAEKEYIAILGIFAAIVLAFTGGIAFSTSVLENLHRSNIYRIISVTLVIGIILLNVVGALFYYIDRIVRSGTERRIKPLIISNVVLLVLLVATVVAWVFGAVEWRNNCIIDGYTQSVVEISTNDPEESTPPAE